MNRPMHHRVPALLCAVTLMLLLQACSDDSATTNNAELRPLVSSSTQTSLANESTQSGAITILALGDSLTEGLGVPRKQTYPAQLQQILNDSGYDGLRVVNAGFSGETTSGLLSRLDWVLKQEPDIVILTIGANDAMRGIPLELVENNLEAIIERILETEARLILSGMQIYNNLGRDYVTGFSDLFPTMAQKYSLPTIPFFLQGVGGVDEYNQADQIHPTGDGYALIVRNNVMPALMPVLEAMMAEQTSEQTD